MSTQIKKNGNWVTVAGGTRMWVGTKAALQAALDAGELVDGTAVMVTDDYEEGEVRRGTFTFVKRPNSNFCDATVTFDTPMPDANYVVDISFVTRTGISLQGRVQAKTARGFEFEGCYCLDTDASIYGNQEVTYTAFKL